MKYSFIKNSPVYTHINDILVLGIIVLISKVVADTVLNNPGMSVTPWIKMIIFIGGLCMVITMLKGPGIFSVLRELFFTKPNLDIKTISIISISAFLLAALIINAQLYLLLWGSIAVLAVMFSLSLYYMASGRSTNSICVYIVSWPLIGFIESQLSVFINSINANFSWINININVLLLFILLYTWFIKQRFVDRMALKSTGISKYILFYMFAAFVSVLFCENFNASLKAYIVSVVYPPIMYLIVVNGVKKREDIEKIVVFLVIAVLLHTLLNFYYYLKYYKDSLASLNFMSYQGFSLSSVLCHTIPFIIYFIISAKRKVLKACNISLIGLFNLIIIYTMSRTAVILSVFSFSVFAIKKHSRRYVVPITILGVVILLLNFDKLAPYLKKFQTLRSVNSMLAEETSISNRIGGFRAGINMFKENSMFGVGVGMYQRHYHKYEKLVLNSNPLYRSERVPMAHAHHMIANYLAEIGGVGMVAILILLAAVFRQSLFILKKNSDDLLALSLSVSYFIFVIMGLTSGAYLGNPCGLTIRVQILWVIIGLISAYYWLNTNKGKELCL